jgi:hypothetical protein
LLFKGFGNLGDHAGMVGEQADDAHGGFLTMTCPTTKPWRNEDCLWTRSYLPCARRWPI